MQFLGIILILVGAFALVDLFTNINLWFTITDFWPSILIIYGIYRLLKKESSKITSYILILIGTLVQLDYLDLLTPRLSKTIWALSLIIIGIFLFMNNRNKNYQYSGTNTHNDNNSNNKYYYNKSSYYDDVKSDSTDEENSEKKNYSSSKESSYEYGDGENYSSFHNINSNLINISHSFGEYKAKVQSDSFSGGDISGNFSQLTVDLRDTVPASNIIELYCSVNVSNLKLLIPTNWSYEVITKNNEARFKYGEEYTLRIYYKNILGELIIN